LTFLTQHTKVSSDQNSNDKLSNPSSHKAYKILIELTTKTFPGASQAEPSHQ